MHVNLYAQKHPTTCKYEYRQTLHTEIQEKPLLQKRTLAITVNTDKASWWGRKRSIRVNIMQDKPFDCKRFPPKYSISIHTLHIDLSFAGSNLVLSYTPEWLAAADFLFTLQGSVLCSRTVTRCGLDKARPVWKREQDAWLFTPGN